MERVEATIAGRLREAMGDRSVKSVAKRAGVQPFTLRQLRAGLDAFARNADAHASARARAIEAEREREEAW